MTEGPAPLRRQAAIQHMMQRRDGFARGLGLYEAATRQIVEQAATDMPMRTGGERMM